MVTNWSIFNRNNNKNVPESTVVRRTRLLDPVAVRRFANFYHVYLLGIALTFGGLYVEWNGGLHGGFAEYMVALLLMSSAFIVLILCSAEMTSILPFSGGAYGFTRITLGPFFGYMVGALDAFRCLTYVSHFVFKLGSLLTSLTGAPVIYQPVFWLVFFIPAIALDLFGSHYFWNIILYSSLLTLLLTVLFPLVAAPDMNFSRYVIDEHVSFESSWSLFVSSLPSASIMYLGLSTLPLCCEETNKPKQTVPRAMISVVLSLFLAGLVIAVAVCSLPPGATDSLADMAFPLSLGYSRSLHLSTGTALVFSLPAVYATCFGYAYSYSRLMCSLARSGLLPSFISMVRGERETPYLAMILGNFLVYLIMLVIFYHHQDINDTAFYQAGIVATVFVYWSIFLSFRLRFGTLNKVYVNPLGLGSAAYAAMVFSLLLLYALGYSSSRYTTLIIFFSFLVLATVYYYSYAGRHQCYSNEEQSLLLVLYVMKANKERHKKQKKFSASPSSKALVSPNHQRRYSSSAPSGIACHPADQPKTKADGLTSNRTAQRKARTKKILPYLIDADEIKEIAEEARNGTLFTIQAKTMAAAADHATNTALMTANGEEEEEGDDGGKEQEKEHTVMMTSSGSEQLTPQGSATTASSSRRMVSRSNPPTFRSFQHRQQREAGQQERKEDSKTSSPRLQLLQQQQQQQQQQQGSRLQEEGRRLDALEQILLQQLDQQAVEEEDEDALEEAAGGLFYRGMSYLRSPKAGMVDEQSHLDNNNSSQLRMQSMSSSHSQENIGQLPPQLLQLAYLQQRGEDGENRRSGLYSNNLSEANSMSSRLGNASVTTAMSSNYSSSMNSSPAAAAIIQQQPTNQQQQLNSSQQQLLFEGSLS